MPASRARQAAEAPLSVDMTPLIDVVFLLLIFFMVIQVLNDIEKMAVKELPEAYQAVVASNVARDRMVINVESSGRIVIYGQTVNMAGLKTMLRQYRTHYKRLLKETGTSPIVLRGHKNTPYGKIKDVLSAIYETGYEKIMFAAYMKKPAD